MCLEKLSLNVPFKKFQGKWYFQCLDINSISINIETNRVKPELDEETELFSIFILKEREREREREIARQSLLF